MKFSFSTTLLPEVRDLEEVTALVAGAGYDGIEWRIHRDYHIDPGEVADRAHELLALCEKYRLAAPCLATYLDWENLPGIEIAVKAAGILRCPLVRLGGFVYDRTRPYGLLLAEAEQAIDRVAPMLRDAGVTAVIETHFGTIHPSAQGLYRLVSRHDPGIVGVVLDGANLCAEGREDWKLMLEVLGPWLRHVHVRNTQWFRSDGGTWQWRWAPLDSGMVPWAEVLALLREQGYDGYVTSENMWGVPKRTTGYIGETVAFMGGSPTARSIQERLADIGFMREASGLGAASRVSTIGALT